MTRDPHAPERHDADKALADVLQGATTEHQQLEVLATRWRAHLTLPADAFVIGEPVQVTAIEYDGNPRRGLRATVRRGGDEHHDVSLADVVFEPGSEGARWAALHRAWLGVDTPVTEGPRPSRARRHKAEAGDLAVGETIDLVVLACKSNALRCRVPGTSRELTLRTAVYDEVPGEIVTVVPAKQWTHAGHPYLSGKVHASRLDVPMLGLAPLALVAQLDWDPSEEFWGDEDEPLEEWAKAIIARGKRPMFEMEQILPGQDPEDPYADPIVEAVELRDAGHHHESEQRLMGLLAHDLRCLDAHAHLGNAEFASRPKQALRHYAVGVAIGDLSLGETFDGVLSWGLVDNRPFLRCLNGLGLCRWRLGSGHEAAAIFRRMLWLNPSDNQGARFNLTAIEDGQTWEEAWGPKHDA